MDLLNENQYKKTKEPKGKKIVIMLLVLSIIFICLIIGLMIYISSNRVEAETLFINDTQVAIENDLLVNDTAGKQYIAIKDLVELLGYEYKNGEYKKDEVDTSKCYVKNNNLITGFELDTNTIYKYEEETTLDYQYYQLNLNIIMYNNKFYIALEDLVRALNCSYSIDENNQIKINSMENLSTTYKEKLKEMGYTIAEDQNNSKSFAYGRIIANKSGVWSIFNSDLEDVGLTYSSIYFDEQNDSYIVSNTSGKYGIITINGAIKEPLKYDGLEILNYKNKLYKVKNNSKYGIVKSDGTNFEKLTEIIYDDIGYPAVPESKSLYTLIIPKLEKNMQETVVVKQNGKYGLIYLSTGDEFLPCDMLDKIYLVNNEGEDQYMVEAQKVTMELLEYLTKRGTYVVEIN